MSEVEREYVIRRCPECGGQVHEVTVAHFGDCPNRSRAFVADAAEVAWPVTSAEPMGEDRDGVRAENRWDVKPLRHVEFGYMPTPRSGDFSGEASGE